MDVLQKKQIQILLRYLIIQKGKIYNKCFIEDFFHINLLTDRNKMSNKQTIKNTSNTKSLKSSLKNSQTLQKQSVQLSQSKLINQKDIPSINSFENPIQKMKQNKSQIVQQIFGKAPESQYIQEKEQQKDQSIQNALNSSQIKQSKLFSQNISNFSAFKLQDEILLGYFSQLSQQQNQNSQKINYYQESILKNLKRQISTGKLKINNQKPFSLKKKSYHQKQEEQQMRQKLEIKRYQALMKIKQIEQQQLSLKRRAVSTIDRSFRKRNSQSRLSKLPDELGNDELKKAMNQYKKFTQDIQKRNQIVEQQKQKQKLLQLQKQEQILKLRRQSRKEQVKSNLKDIMQRDRVRKSILQEWKTKQKEIKNKKYLYLEYKKKQIQDFERQQIQKQIILQKIRANHKFDKNEIEDHQRKHDQLAQERRQLSKSLSASSITNRQEIKHYQVSKFREIAIKQLEQIKKKQLQKIMKVKQNEMKEKMLKYQEKVQRQIRPKLHYKKFEPIPRTMSVDALDPQKHRELGMKYLQKAKKLKKSQDELKLSSMKKQSQQRLKLSRTKNSYKDYLKQIKKDLKYDPTQKKIQQLLDKKRAHSNYQNLKEAKYLTQYLVQKSKNTEDGKTMLAIQKKMDILNSIY